LNEIQALAVINSAITFGQIHVGLGDPTPPPLHELHRSQFLLWLAYLFFFPALACSLLSISSLLARIIGPHRRTVRVAHAVALAVVMWGGVCEFVYAFSCALPRPWVITAGEGECINLVTFFFFLFLLLLLFLLFPHPFISD